MTVVTKLIVVCFRYKDTRWCIDFKERNFAGITRKCICKLCELDVQIMELEKSLKEVTHHHSRELKEAQQRHFRTCGCVDYRPIYRHCGHRLHRDPHCYVTKER